MTQVQNRAEAISVCEGITQYFLLGCICISKGFKKNNNKLSLLQIECTVLCDFLNGTLNSTLIVALMEINLIFLRTCI